MTRPIRSAALTLAITLALPVLPASAHHRQTAPIVQLSSTGDAAWPRLPAWSDRVVVALPSAGGSNVFLRNRDRVTFTALTNTGSNEDPVGSGSAAVAWSSDADLAGTGSSGRQIFLAVNRLVTQLTHDPTGTCANPAIDRAGAQVAFESSGDLAKTGSASRQVFAWSRRGTITQVSAGLGTSGNPAYDAGGRHLVFDSTSDPSTGADTGVSQVWMATAGGHPAPLTAGHGASSRPSLSPEGRFVVLQSSAALAGDGSGTGTSQIFVYDVGGAHFRQLTNDAGGCTKASINASAGAWRVGYVCGSRGFYAEFSDPASPKRFALPFSGGDTTTVVPGGGNWFLLVSTTANPSGGSPTSGHELYQFDLFKLPGTPAP